jgi:hypothetical protein
MKVIKHPFFWISIPLLAMVYWYGFYKNYQNNCIPKNADTVIMLDLKNIRNKLLFYHLIHPSKWGKTTKKSNNDKLSIIESCTKRSDYIALFHIKNQPRTVFYCATKISSESDFSKMLENTRKEKIDCSNDFKIYFLPDLNLIATKYKDRVLWTNLPKKNWSTTVQTAKDLFIDKVFIDEEKIKKTIHTQNTITIWIQKREHLNDDAIVEINFDQNKIEAYSKLKIPSEFLQENTFTDNKKALLSLGINLKKIGTFNFNKTTLNKRIGFDIDRILSKNPTKTELVLAEIIEKKETVIEYEFDENFDQIEKKIFHNYKEPSFEFSVQFADSKAVFEYLKNQEIINKEEVFVNFPFAKTKVNLTRNSFVLKANSPQTNPLKTTQKKIAFLHINFNQLQSKDWDFILNRNQNIGFLRHFSTLNFELKKEKDYATLNLCLQGNEHKNLIAHLIEKI